MYSRVPELVLNQNLESPKLMGGYKTQSQKPGLINGIRQFCLGIRHLMIQTFVQRSKRNFSLPIVQRLRKILKISYRYRLLRWLCKKMSPKFWERDVTKINCPKGSLSWKSQYSNVKKDLSGCIDCSGIKLYHYIKATLLLLIYLLYLSFSFVATKL